MSNVFYIASGLLSFGTNICSKGLSELFGTGDYLSTALALKKSALSGLSLGELMTVWFISLIVHLGIMILIVAIVITLASRIIEAAERSFVSDSELFSKYSFLNESVSQSILDEFRVGEYRLKTTGVDTLTNATVYFDINGKVVSVRNHVSDSVFKTTIGDIRNYIPEDELRAVFPEYDSLENLEKLKVRQLELEYNKFIKNLDSIPVEQISDVRANYLKAVGKTEDTLGFFDKRILKLLEGKLSVLKDRFI